jgi:hypothetical protein
LRVFLPPSFHSNPNQISGTFIPKLSDIEWEAEETLLLHALKKAQTEYSEAPPEQVKDARRRYLDALRKFKEHVMPERRSLR